MVRHQIRIRDAALAVALVFTAGFVAFEYEFSGNFGGEKAIQFQEMIALGVLFVAVVGFLAFQQMMAQEHEIARRIAAERRAHELAHTDPLTGLANRREFERALRTRIATPAGAEGVHAVLTLDLNGFKKVNDLYGHPEGDDLLVVVAKRLSAAMREGDLLARMGGDEFAILAHHLAGPEAATSITNRIIKALEPPIRLGPNQHVIGAGIGIALIGREGSHPDDLLRKADIALYRAKAEKRSVARFFEENMDQQSRERAILERDLATAIGTDALRPWYQPVVNLRTGEIVGLEALARWRHPALGDIPPDRFIPIAEDCGLIRELSDHLLRCACDDARAWPNHVVLSFNISPEQLRDATLGLRILRILGSSGFPPHRLEIEITESAIVRDIEAAKEVISSLRGAGVRIALDDFGTGYSSLYHLRSLKFDKLKIDRSFIESLEGQEESAIIVRALTGLGHGLGLTITGEGIETADQRDVLLGQGCDQGQGFLFSRALPADHVRHFLANFKSGSDDWVSIAS